jgi:hypothetical protein
MRLIEKVMQRALVVEALYAPLNRFVTYVGPRYPDRLLFGDVRGPAFQTDDPIDKLRPCFMPYRSLSGSYLWRTIAHEWSTTDGSVGVANACDVDDPTELWSTLGRPRTTVLGKNAERCFMSYQSTAPHPQWVRRFHHNRIGDYRDQIMNGTAIRWN